MLAVYGDGPNMIPKQLSAISALICFLLQLSLPAKSCLESCHSQGEDCHRAALTLPESSKCSHAQPISAAKITAKSGCACAIQPESSATREVQFTLDYPRSERSKASGSDTEFSSKVIPVLLEARLHGPPFCLTPDRRDTFLINSILRI
jgi:hypothetical protein